MHDSLVVSVNQCQFLSADNMNTTDKQYQNLFKKYVKAFPEKTPAVCQRNVSELWKEEIKKGKHSIDDKKYEEELAKLNNIIVNREKKGGIQSFFQKKTKKTINPTVLIPEKEPVIVDTVEPSDDQTNDEAVVTLADDNDNDAMEEKHTCPVQDKLKMKIAEKEKALTNLNEARNLNLGDESTVTLTKKIRDVMNERDELQKELKRKEQNMKNNKAYRARRRAAEDRLKIEHPEMASTLKLREGVGRPRIECDQEGVMDVILQIAMIGSACGDRRREDVFRTVKTLDDLHKAVTDLGFIVSRSALYLRLLPRDQTSIHGKRHVKTVQVKLVRPENDLRTKHPDRMFAAETSKAADKIATFLGPLACVYLSQDDKSSVFIGKTAAKKQSSILMNMRYRVRLPDHDFAVGSRHLLVPSVMAICEINPKTGVSYSGPTYIGVRSSKHNNSTAFSHQQDLLRFREVNPEIFDVPDSPGVAKPVLIKGVDGGPDENPRFEKNITMACKTFQVKSQHVLSVNCYYYSSFHTTCIRNVFFNSIATCATIFTLITIWIPDVY